MLIPDVNVLIYAFREDSERHQEYREWFEAKLTGYELVGLSELVLSGFLRIVTNHRAFKEPSRPAKALEFCQAALSAPTAAPVRPGSRNWAVFSELYGKVQAKGNVVADLYHAALAIEHDATWVTTDRGFARFPDLRWELPLEAP